MSRTRDTDTRGGPPLPDDVGVDRRQAMRSAGAAVFLPILGQARKARAAEIKIPATASPAPAVTKSQRLPGKRVRSSLALSSCFTRWRNARDAIFFQG